MRALTSAAGTTWRLLTRTGRDASDAFPELAVLPQLMAGRPSFTRLQQRMGVRSPDPALLRRVPALGHPTTRPVTSAVSAAAVARNASFRAGLATLIVVFLAGGRRDDPYRRDRQKAATRTDRLPDQMTPGRAGRLVCRATPVQ
ncbi:hypothetical protein ACIBSW_12620 [Actinoplanes sp. NPDC049668]|uniref:hypothetical protein n=1 Tax=unclassified Actinoplanes TaxID=2626549 RepID=UPI0033BC0CD1